MLKNMEKKVWSIEFSPDGKKEFNKLDPLIQKKIINFLYKRIKTGEDPQLSAKPLSGNLKHFWRYRIGDYRLICEFKEQNMIIFVVRVAHRSYIYE